ncbi:hypothetical protein WBG78_30320 [Chryseolinea sp. T2]|uniref:hypothetical protein n=1 Tax=Chryseolinea sp. T2 TaxID=3129255 RepID=UPI003077FEBF
MKTTTLLFALCIGSAIPAYSQVNRHQRIEPGTRQNVERENQKLGDFGNYTFADKFTGTWSVRATDNFNMTPAWRRTIKSTKEIISGDDMPCLEPKGGYIPCLNPKGVFPMRVYTPERVIWGTLWAPNNFY